jgi:hypothetical protein
VDDCKRYGEEKMMDSGFQEWWEKRDIRIEPSPIMWLITERIKRIDEITKDDDIDENNYDSGYCDGLYEEKRHLEHINNMILTHTSFREQHSINLIVKKYSKRGCKTELMYEEKKIDKI